VGTKRVLVPTTYSPPSEPRPAIGGQAETGVRPPQKADNCLDSPPMVGDDLQAGDLVYHPQHGTGRYLGKRVIDAKRYIELEFANNDRIFVPEQSAGTISRVPNDGTARIDRLRKGGQPPPQPRSLIMDRASRLAGGPGVMSPDARPDLLLTAAQQAGPERRERVKRAAEAWISRLIDLSRRNRLLYFWPLKVRTVEFSADEILRALPLVGGQAVAVSAIFPRKELVRGDPETELVSEIEELEEADLGVIRRLQEIQKRGDEDFEERGLETVSYTHLTLPTKA